MLLVKNGTICNADAMFKADVLIANEKIVQIAPSIAVPKNCRVIDATGKLVIPGGEKRSLSSLFCVSKQRKKKKKKKKKNQKGLTHTRTVSFLSWGRWRWTTSITERERQLREARRC
jgi:formylmethanofuran dehydrogenase subunit A